MTESTLIMGLNGEGLGGVMEKIRKTREGKPKSRNGCRTCKLRRVKCDETKPLCMRCTRFGQRCDGYISKTPSKSSLQSTQVRMLAPRAVTAAPANRELSESPERSISPKSPIFVKTPEKMAAFHNFCAQLTERFSTIDSREWAKFVLRLFEDTPSIQYSILAYGSLAATEKQSQDHSVGSPRHQYDHQQRPQEQKCLFQRATDTEPSNFRSAMTGSLLFSSFDGFQVLQELPIERFRSGMSLLMDWFSNFYGSGNLRQPVLEVDMHPGDVEIIRAFKSMEVQFMSHLDRKEDRGVQEALAMGSAGLNHMPATFETVLEAKTALEVVIRKNIHWLRSLTGARKHPPVDEGNGTAIVWSRPLDTNSQSATRLSISREYERWDEAFRPLLVFARSKGSSEENFLRASLLRLHWLSGYLNVSTNNSLPSIVNDRQLKIELEEAISIGGLLLRSLDPPPRGSSPRGTHNTKRTEAFTKREPILDLEVIIPVLALGWASRHIALRKQAIDLLLKAGGEHAWDVVVVGKAIAWLARVEEENLGLENKDGDAVVFVPDNAALRRIEITADTERRLMVIRCLQPVRGGKEVERKLELSW